MSHEFLSWTIEIAGWIGGALILLAYGLLSSRKLTGTSATYQLMNICGSIGMLANGLWNNALPSAALNAIWLVIGAVALFRLRNSP